jgi:uncharacterized protein (TIGR00730 family)
MMIRRICVFCGSISGKRPVYREAARAFGGLLADQKIGLVFGGGRVGLMGTLADAVLERGGEAIGVIPRALMEKEVGHLGLTELRVVDSMHERKALMSDLSDAFVALPGGYGTLDEFCEVLTWAQLGLHQKPCGLLNVDGYFNDLLALFKHALGEGFLHPIHSTLVLAEADPQKLLELVLGSHVPRLDKWLDRTEV